MRSREILLFESPTVRVVDYHCREHPNTTSNVETVPEVEITYTRTGHFLYRGFKQQVEIDHTKLLLKNAGSEHRVSHDRVVRDTCTGLTFSGTLFQDYRFPVSAVAVTPLLDYLHSDIYNALTSTTGVESLRIDELSIRFLKETFSILSHHSFEPVPQAVDTLRTRHREAMERAKHFILQNYTRDLTLREIARNALISEFHFSRIFKAVTSRTPHQFLLDVRFQHAAMLLRDTSVAVTDICFASGFNNLPHFIAAFRTRFGLSPREYRKNPSRV